jgi:WhiB family transcriptional regulator, redox-sensing transcriptional regulator
VVDNVALLDRLDILGAPASIDEADVSWMTGAECLGQAVLFFPPLAERPDARTRRETAAKAICATCPSLAPCREYGRAHHEYGVWGGENEEERVGAGYRLNAPVGVRKRPTTHTAHTA